jgi:IS30 family transposase
MRESWSLSAEQKELAFRLRARGWTVRDIGREIGCSGAMVHLIVCSGKHLDADPFGWEPRQGCLTVQEREQILLGLGRNESLSDIARSLGRSASTVTREVNANGGREQYSAWRAHERARHKARRPKPYKLMKGSCCGRSPVASSSSGHLRRSPDVYRWTIRTTQRCA